MPAMILPDCGRRAQRYPAERRAMPRISSKRRILHSATQMFDLVADVERYPEFVPLCKSLNIRERTPKPDGTEIVICEMTVSFKLVRETFTTRVTLDRPNLKILVEYLKGPFSNLENRWTFEQKSDHACDVGFFLSYEFKSRMLALLMGTMFDTAFQRFAAAFEMQNSAVAGGDREMHEADRLARCRPSRAGNSGNGDGKIDPGFLQRADRHRGRGLLADRAECRKRRCLDPEHHPLGVVGISDKAAVDHVRRSGDIGQCAGDQAAGAGFRGRDGQLAHPAEIEQRAGEGAGVAAAHFSRSDLCRPNLYRSNLYRSKAGGWW